MPNYRLSAVLAVLAGLAGPALAEDALANRFQMEKTENGIVRLDTVTGAMTLCVEKDGAIVCAPGSRPPADVDQARIADLEARIVALEARLEELQAKSSSPDSSAEPGTFPDDAEIDRAVGAMQKFMRGFFGMVDELRKDFEPEEPQTDPAPQRT